MKKSAYRRAKALQEVNEKIAAQEATTLTLRLGRIQSEYASLITELRRAGDQEGLSTVQRLVSLEQTDEVKSYVQEQVRDIEESLTDSQVTSTDERLAIIRSRYEALFAEIDGLADASTVASIEQTRDALVLSDIEQRINDQLSLRADILSAIQAENEAGLLTQTEAQTRISEFNAATLPELQEMVNKAMEFAEAMGNDALIATLQRYRAELTQVNQTLLITEQQVNTTFANSFVSAFDSFVDGTKNAKDAFRDFASDFLRQIARMIIQQAVLNALKNSSFGGAVSGGVNSSVNHTGGIVGQTHTRRFVPAELFQNAVKYHTGGISGLKPDEVPTITRKGEEILTENDPRHRKNLRSDISEGMQLTMINNIDSDSVVSGASGRTIVNMIRANKSQIKQVLT